MAGISLQIASNTNLNHRNTVLQLIKIHKYFEDNLGEKSKGGGGGIVNFEGIFSFYEV